MKSNKTIRKELNARDEAIGDDFKPYVLPRVYFKLGILILILILSFFLLKSVNKLAFVSPAFLFIALGISICCIIAFLVCFIKSSIPLKIKLRLYSIYDTLSFCLITINILLFIILFIFVPTEVSGDSMNNSFYNKDKLLVWHIGYSPKRDDVVIVDINDHYDYFFNEETFFIKRVIAQEGDHISYDNGSLYVNNILIQTKINLIDYIKMTSYQSQSVLEDGYLMKGFSIVMGDNRSNSIDSRRIGAINNEDVEGKVIFRYYSQYGNFGIPKKNING